MSAVEIVIAAPAVIALAAYCAFIVWVFAGIMLPRGRNR